jgi:hypothetical protein
LTFYFDTRTGQRVTKSTWKRSKAHVGTRYKRRTQKPTLKPVSRQKVRQRPAKARTEWVIVRSGYSGRDKNSYTVEVIMNRYAGIRSRELGKHRPRTDQELSNAVERLCAQGKLDAAAEKGDYDGKPVSDLSWATFHNLFSVYPSSNSLRSKRGVKLVGFYREAP